MINKNKIFYRFQDNTLNEKDVAQELIKNIIVKATPSSSCWWSKMKHRADEYKDKVDRIVKKQINFIKTGEEYLANDDEGMTVKTCPGILGLFNQAYLVKSPVDIVITINKRGGIVFDIADNKGINISTHSQSQFYQDDNQMFKDKICVKFVLPVRLKTTGFGYMLADPTYHSNSGCYVPMGLINDRYANNQELNIITFIDIPKDEDTKTIKINTGDVIAYLIPFEKCSLSLSKENFIAKRYKSNFIVKNWFKE